MDNPFKKESHTGLIVTVVIASIAAAGLAYLFFTEEGEEILDGLKHKVKDTVKDIAAGVVSKKTGVSKKTVKTAADVVEV
jgi:hypothetical protein